jgi:putative RNA 2'-phosphotransferase
MATDRNDKQLSKLLSLVLRHDPAHVGIELDEHGWAQVDALISAIGISRGDLERIVAESDKQRFAFSDDGARIRANQGHSVEVDLGLAPAVPPARLFHGTVASALPGIRAHGLLRGSRQYVHLSPDETTARAVGARRGKPVVLVVRAAEMVAAGHVFYVSANGVWLVDHVPVELIDF